MVTEKDPQPDTIPGWSTWMSAGTDAVERVHLAFDEWCEVVLKIQEDTARFIQERIDENTRVANEIVECGDPVVIFELQQSWVQNTTEACTAQVERVFETCFEGKQMPFSPLWATAAPSATGAPPSTVPEESAMPSADSPAESDERAVA